MEVKITKHGGSQFMLAFEPKSKDDEKTLKDMAKTIGDNNYIFFSRGFEYMEPKIEFLAQKASNSD